MNVKPFETRRECRNEIEQLRSFILRSDLSPRDREAADLAARRCMVSYDAFDEKVREHAGERARLASDFDGVREEVADLVVTRAVLLASIAKLGPLHLSSADVDAQIKGKMVLKSVDDADGKGSTFSAVEDARGAEEMREVLSMLRRTEKKAPLPTELREALSSLLGGRGGPVSTFDISIPRRPGDKPSDMIDALKSAITGALSEICQCDDCKAEREAAASSAKAEAPAASKPAADASPSAAS